MERVSRWMLALIATLGMACLGLAWRVQPWRTVGSTELWAAFRSAEDELATAGDAPVLTWSQDAQIGVRRDLFSPWSLLAADDPDETERLREFAGLPCDQVLARRDRWSSPASIKWIRLRSAFCSGRPFLEREFQEAPVVSPLGASFVKTAAGWIDAKDRKAFMAARRDGLHALELAEVAGEPGATPEQIFLGELDFTGLDAFAKGVGRFVSDKRLWVLLESTRQSVSYRVYPLESIRSALAGRGVDVRSADRSCEFAVGKVCLLISEQRRLEARALAVGLMGLFILALGLVAVLWRSRADLRKRFERDRQTLLETLAHELRHPVTSIRLSLEAFRGQFDRLSEGAQDEFLRMCDQTARLRRLVEMSRQYVRVDGPNGEVFSFASEPIESLNDLASEICRPYLDRIAFEPLENDRSTRLDTYWFSLCATNLIKNALMHGEKPVVARLKLDGARFAFQVLDAGPVPRASLKDLVSERPKESARGMGIGLSLVHRLMSGMGGRLVLNAEPKFFALELELGCEGSDS